MVSVALSYSGLELFLNMHRIRQFSDYSMKQVMRGKQTELLSEGLLIFFSFCKTLQIKLIVCLFFWHRSTTKYNLYFHIENNLR